MVKESTKRNMPGFKEKRYQQKRGIISHLYKNESLSKPDICRLTNMTAPTISKIIDELIEEGWVEDLGEGASIGGKKPHIFSLHPDAAYVLGIDIGRIHLKIAVFNLKKEIIGKIGIYPSILETGKTNKENTTYIKEKVLQMLCEEGIPYSKIKVAGVALPGLIDLEGNSYTYLTYEDTNIKAELENELDIPVFIDNDSNVMALAEHSFGLAKEASNTLCISISECIGLGLILNTQPYSGSKGMAGEFGHIRMSGVDEPCHCGKRGCLEAIASGRALIREAEKIIAEGTQTAISALSQEKPITLATIISAAKQDDIVAIDLLQRAGEKIGEGMATLIHLLNPELIIIGGEIADSGELITAPIQQALTRYALAKLKAPCEIRLSNLNSNATILGTLMMVLKDLYYRSESEFSLYV